MNETALRWSGAHTWLVCAASVPLQRAHPDDDDTEDARFGTCAHWVCAEYLLGGELMPVGSVCPDGGVAVTGDMHEWATVFRALVTADVQAPDVIEVERYLHTGVVPMVSGTPDAIVVSRSRKYVAVWDFKSGFAHVDAFENPQLLGYLCEVIQYYGLDSTWKFDLGVYQPRYGSGEPRVWSPSWEFILQWLERARRAALDTIFPEPLATVNRGCKFCSARAHCGTLQMAAYDAAAMTTRAIDQTLTPHALGLELARLESLQSALNARIDGLREQALSEIKSGKRVTHYHAGTPRANLKWDDPQTIPLLETFFATQLYKPREPVTPTQAIARKLLPESVVQQYASRPARAAALMRDDPNHLRKIFGG